MRPASAALLNRIEHAASKLRGAGSSPATVVKKEAPRRALDLETELAGQVGVIRPAVSQRTSLAMVPCGMAESWSAQLAGHVWVGRDRQPLNAQA